MRLRLYRRIELPFPTLLGWGALAAIGLIVTVAFVAFAHPFLAVNQPVGGQALVVEGWISQGLLGEVITEFRRGRYRWLVTTGGPMSPSTYLRRVYPGIDNYADLAASALIELGVGRDSLVSIPAPPVDRNRTFAGAVRLGKWIESHESIRAIDVLTQGTHARRSWLIYRMAIGDRALVGVISRPTNAYDVNRWWATSAGVRSLINEAIAYIYFKLLFYP